MEKDEQMEWMLYLSSEHPGEVTIGPLGTPEYYERYYHENGITGANGG
jgi:ABC-2 type transport system ATP-binding protein